MFTSLTHSPDDLTLRPLTGGGGPEGQREEMHVTTTEYIYTPKGRAAEYAELACNVYRGCDHGCRYCYAPATLRMTPETFAHPVPRQEHFLELLDAEGARKEKKGLTGQVLLSFACDPYCHLNERYNHTGGAIEILHAHGFSVCTLTKGGERALDDLDLFTSRDAFATTLTTLCPDMSAHWEPRAAAPMDRISALQQYHEAGIPTWVSLEPVIDPVSALRIIREYAYLVDFWKVGKLNHHPFAATINWAWFAAEAVKTLQAVGANYRIKDDLATYLPVEIPRFSATA